MDSNLVLRLLYVSREACCRLGLAEVSKSIETSLLVLAISRLGATNRCNFNLYRGFVSREIHLLGRGECVLFATCVPAPDSILCPVRLAK